jgi:arginine utilization protein RocB
MVNKGDNMSKILILIAVGSFILGGLTTYFFIPRTLQKELRSIDSQIQAISQIQTEMNKLRTNNIAEDDVFKQGITELAKLKTDDNTQLLMIVGNQWAENSNLRKTNENDRQILKAVAEALDEYSKKINSYPGSYPRFTSCRSSIATSSVDCYSY